MGEAQPAPFTEESDLSELVDEALLLEQAQRREWSADVYEAIELVLDDDHKKSKSTVPIKRNITISYMDKLHAVRKAYFEEVAPTKEGNHPIHKMYLRDRAYGHANLNVNNPEYARINTDFLTGEAGIFDELLFRFGKAKVILMGVNRTSVKPERTLLTLLPSQEVYSWVKNIALAALRGQNFANTRSELKPLA